MQSTFNETMSTTRVADALYTVDITKFIGAEYVDMFNDMARFVIIQIAIQLMLFIMDSSKFPFFSGDFFILLLFIIIGVMLYWLIFKKIVSFK